MQGGPALPAARTWFKSSYSGANTTECVEACLVVDGIAIRDSKAPAGNVATFGARPWGDFLLSLRDPGHRGPLGVS
ncbi:DUF397 domain-containing protein [Streptomyces sp. NBC_00356]|uniref:DUF397 domain-containing protein n=1 Tax=Streptomyces sp. NBC_00356 TaxID=2975724 RepID=UPI002E25B068